MIDVLLWLDRFDLDGKQITARRLRSLVEHKQVPLRKVDRVDYDGVWRDVLDSPGKINSLSICREQDEGNGPVKVELPIETDADVQKAASYLSSCFVRAFYGFGHYDELPKNPIIEAPALIRALDFQYCNFDNGETDALSETLNGSVYRSLSLVFTYVPDDDLPVPESGSLDITLVNITPEFFTKVVEASKNSQLTCDVELCFEELQFDVDSSDLGVQPSRSSEYDEDLDADVHHIRYDFADHGNGIRLLIHFQRDEGDDEWTVTIRHGKTEHEAFFEPQP